MASVNPQRRRGALDLIESQQPEQPMDNNTNYGGGLESQRRRQIGDAYRGYSGGQEATEDIYQKYLRDDTYETGIKGMFAQQAQPQQGNGGIFTDPGAQRWEGAVNNAASRLQQPQANPDFAPYVDYMRKYFAQLQQPGFTPAQQDLMQTQALDPMERQRTAAKQQVTQRFAQQGVQGGLVERALQDVDRQFNELRTKSQGNFAMNQIGYDQQRQQQAAQVGASLSQAQQAAATNDEGRMMQALSLLFQIPQYADTRMMNANSVLQPLNPTSLLQSLAGINASNQGQNNFNAQQNAQFWGQLGQLLAQSFGG
jgi:hypothetical protein